MRIALAANRASGGGLDPAPLAAAMRERGAEVGVFGCHEAELERAAAWRPERIAVAGGDGEVRAGDGLERVTVKARAFSLVVPGGRPPRAAAGRPP